VHENHQFREEIAALGITLDGASPSLD